MRLALLLTLFLVSAQAGTPVYAHGATPSGSLSGTVTIGGRIVGIEVSKMTGEAYAFTDRGIVSGGYASHLSWTRAPYPYEGPLPPWTIVAAAMDRQNKTHIWYDDQGTLKHTKGTIGAPESLKPLGTVGAAGRTPADIIDIAFEPNSITKVLTWWRDGTVTRGSWSNLTAGSAEPFTSPIPLHDIAGIGLDASGKVLTWYRDGTYSIGDTNNLDRYTGDTRPFYAHLGMMKSSYERPWTPPAVPAAVPPPVVSQRLSVDSGDLTVAAGHRFLGVAYDADVQFFSRDGQTLSGGALTSNGWLSMRALFGSFRRPHTGRRRTDANHYTVFPDGPGSCTDLSGLIDGYGKPMTSTLYDDLCMSDFYDTRVEYDKRGRRFVIIAQMRNAIKTRYLSANPTENYSSNPDPKYAGHTMIQGSYTDGDRHSFTSDPKYGLMARRFKVIAISKTDDPRAGFDTYILLHNDMKDWPMMSINGDWLILANNHVKETHIAGALGTLISLRDLRAGHPAPEYVRFYPKDLPRWPSGERVQQAQAPRHHGDTPGHSMLLTWGPSDIHAITLPHPTRRFEKLGASISTISYAPLSGGFRFPLDQAVYRGGYLYMVGKSPYSIGGSEHWGLSGFWAYVPVFSGAAPAGRFVATMGGSLIPLQLPSNVYASPAPQVSASGALSVVFGRYTKAITGQSIYSMRLSTPTSWPATVTRWASTATGNAALTKSHGTKAVTAAVDPVDDQRIFFVHHGTQSDGRRRAILGSFVP